MDRHIVVGIHLPTRRSNQLKRDLARIAAFHPKLASVGLIHHRNPVVTLIRESHERSLPFRHGESQRRGNRLADGIFHVLVDIHVTNGRIRQEAGVVALEAIVSEQLAMNAPIT